MYSTTIILIVGLSVSVYYWAPKYSLIPLFTVLLLIPVDQRIDILGINITALRWILLITWSRIVIRKEVRKIKVNYFDVLIIGWKLTGSLIYFVNRQSLQSFVYTAGETFDILVPYFLFRMVVRDWDDLRMNIKILTIAAVISAPLILYDKISGVSLFGIFGHTIAVFHTERSRCAGAFPHFIIMGCFWASLIPLFWTQNESVTSKWNAMGVIGGIVCVICSASSTPILALLVVLVALGIYRYRQYINIVMLVTGLSIMGTHIFMKMYFNVPVWYLATKMNVYARSQGWHRFKLIDQFYRHFSEWAVLGTAHVKSWAIFNGDVTNQFILEAVNGGLLTLLVLSVIMVVAIKVSSASARQYKDKLISWLCWGVFCMFICHIIAFLGVSYYGQIITILAFSFSLIGYLVEKSEEMLKAKQAVALAV